MKAAFDAFMETKEDTKANVAATDALVAELVKAAAAGCRTLRLHLLRKITSVRSPYGSSVVMDGHMISVSVD